MKHLTHLLTIFVGIILIGSTASAQLTVTGGSLFVPDGGVHLSDDYDLDWIGTGTRIGARPWVMSFQVGGELPMQIFNDNRVIVGPTGAATDANPIRLQVHGRSMVGALGIGHEDGDAISAMLHSKGTIRSDAGLQLADDYELDWVGTGTRIGGRSYKMSFEVGGQLPMQIFSDNRVLVGPTGAATDANPIRLQVHGRSMVGALGIGLEDGEALGAGAKLEVAGQVKITGGSPGAGKVLTSDGEGLASWETASAGAPGAQGAPGAPGAQGAQGKQGPPGQDSSTDCVECSELQQIIFDAVCKIFDGAITNTSEVSECIAVIGQLALVGVDVCSPNEETCLSVILGNVQDLLDSK